MAHVALHLPDEDAGSQSQDPYRHRLAPPSDVSARTGAKIATLGDGQYFGEMALLSNRTRNAMIRARIETDVLIIPKAEFDKLRHSVPAFAGFFKDLANGRTLPKPPASTAHCSHDCLRQSAGLEAADLDRLDPLGPFRCHHLYIKSGKTGEPC